MIDYIVSHKRVRLHWTRTPETDIQHRHRNLREVPGPGAGYRLHREPGGDSALGVRW
jgi:hypothetical protein